MQNMAILLSDSDYFAIRNGGECVAHTIAEKNGCSGIQSMKLIDCGSFYRLLVEYETYRIL